MEDVKVLCFECKECSEDVEIEVHPEYEVSEQLCFECKWSVISKRVDFLLSAIFNSDSSQVD